DRFVRTTLIGTFFFGSCTLVALLWMRDATPPATLIMLPWMIPGAIAGNVLGAHLSDKIPRAAFARIVGALLLLSGAGLVFRALI
ncbi:MAG: putative membrane protein YfcA, partial [Cognaticolwellia sp.]